MYRTSLILAVLLAVGGGAAAHEPTRTDGGIDPAVDTEAKPWTSLELNNDPNVIRFAVVTDNAGGPRPGVFGEAVAKLNLLQPEFVMSIGDFIEGYEDTREALNLQWDRFLADVAKFEMPFFFVPGNHDVGRPLWAEIYAERFGVAYYHFVYKDVLFLCLNTNDGPENGTGISDAQIEYVRKTLADHPDVRWTLVFQHKPLWNENNEGWKRVQELLKDRSCTVFAGHTHNYLSQEDEGISFITMATTGGGSRLRGPAFGEFDGVVWVTLNENGPRVANLLLDGILDKDFRTPKTAKGLALFSTGQAVAASPVLYEGPRFESGVSRLSLTNPLDMPLRVKVLTETEPGMRVEPSTVSAIVPGGSTKEVELRITSDEPRASEDVQPVVLHWEAAYDTDDNTPSVKLEGQHRVPIDAPFTIAVRDSAPTVDGRLDDWDDLPFRVDQPGEIFQNATAWKGPHDGSYRFAVARHGDHLYVAVKATDNEPCFDGWKYWEDFAMVVVDGRGSNDEDLRESAFSVTAGPEFPPEQGALYSMGEAPPGVQSASVATEDGFTAEFAIPVSYLEERQGGDWRRVRLNVAVSDFDRGDARDGVTILHWRPQWTTRNTYPESGLFLNAPE